jgi:hypothetical protein
MLVSGEFTIPPTTVIVTTTVAARFRKPESGGGINLRLPDGSWVWLLLIVPFFLGLIGVYLWRRAFKAAEWVDVAIEGAKTDAEQTFDKDGPFHICKKPDKDEELPINQRVLVKIEVDDLPLTKPLGLELLECKVNRVHPAAKKYDWQVGDIIMQVGSYPVFSFEDIWLRIQVERDRLPCIFMVERQAMAPSYLDFRGQVAVTTEAIKDDGSHGNASQGHGGHHTPGTHSPHSPAQSSRLHSPKTLIDSRIGSAQGGSRASTKLLDASRTSTKDLGGHGPHHKLVEGDRASVAGIASLRDAALAAAEEGSEDFADFEQPSGQEWRAEYNAREEMNRQKVVHQGRNLQDPHRVMENLRTIEITRGIRESMTSDQMNKVMSQFGQVEQCHMGTRDREGQFIALPFVRFRTVMATEACMTALKTGDVEMEDLTCHGVERGCKLKGERKQDVLWHVPGQVQGSTPRGAKHPPRDGDQEEAQEHGFGEWWTEPVQEREETPEEFYSAIEGWQQWQLEQDQEEKPPTVWEEARAKDDRLENAFEETVPYHAWLEDAKALHPEEVGDPKEWVCSVCKRGNKLVETHCLVCHSDRRYKNSKLVSAAKPRVLLPTDGIQKIPNSRVVFKEDAWGRSVYDTKP